MSKPGSPVPSLSLSDKQKPSRKKPSRATLISSDMDMWKKFKDDEGKFIDGEQPKNYVSPYCFIVDPDTSGKHCSTARVSYLFSL